MSAECHVKVPSGNRQVVRERERESGRQKQEKTDTRRQMDRQRLIKRESDSQPKIDKGRQMDRG